MLTSGISMAVIVCRCLFLATRKQVLLWVGIYLELFTALLMYNSLLIEENWQA